LVVLAQGAITIAGNINANGYGGNGGGGGGGVVVLASPTSISVSGTVLAKGGAGGLRSQPCVGC